MKQALLKSRDKTICEKLSSQRTLEGKRAKALLALNDGDTQVIAANKSGLTYGQVKYLLSVFRKQGMSIFPEQDYEKARKTSKKSPQLKGQKSKIKDEDKDKKKKKDKKNKKKKSKKDKDKTKKTKKEKKKKSKKKSKKK
jgi:outer membrane biosynthesis protein TonB